MRRTLIIIQTIGLPLLLMGVLALASTMSVQAQIDPATVACDGIKAAGAGCADGTAQVKSTIQTVIELLLYIVGVASVIGVVIGGMRFTVSGGDQQAVATARRTVAYSLVGVIVAVLAWFAVSFVYGKLNGTA